jgi:hypothetical protein
VVSPATSVPPPGAHSIEKDGATQQYLTNPVGKFLRR